MLSSNVQRLFDAAACGDVQTVSTMLQSGISANVRNACGQTPLIVASRAGRCDAVILLLANGARVGARTDPLLGLTEPILSHEVYATYDRARASLMTQEMLQNGGERLDPDTADLDALDLLDSTDDLLSEAGPLLSAAVCGHVPVVDALLRAGAEPNAVDWAETPPLVGAAAQGHMEVVEQLLGAGADVDAGMGFTALEESIVNGHEVVVRRLLGAGADVDRRNEDGGTPLMIAAATGRLSIVRMLVESGADVDVVTDGEAALSCAAAYGHLSVYAYLLPRSTPAVQARGDMALGAYLEYVAQL